MQGIICINNKRYLFRDDTGYGGVWAWDIDEEIKGDRVMTHKWDKMKNRNADYFIFFELDNPPQTVSYLPLLG